MEKINKIGIYGILVIMLIGIGINIAFGDKLYDIHDYVRVVDYEIDVTKYVSDNFTIYVENNETIITSGKMENCSNGFSGCPTNYSGNYSYGESTLGNDEKYYILVYDGSDNGVSTYDTIAWSIEKNFTNAIKNNQTKKVGEQFTVSGKSYTLLSIAGDGSSIVLKPIFSINVSKLNNTLNNAHSFYFQKFANVGDSCKCVDVIVLDFKYKDAAGLYDPYRDYSPCKQRIYLDAFEIIKNDDEFCGVPSHEYAHRFHDCIGTINDQNRWNQEGFAEYASSIACNLIIWERINPFKEYPDVTLPWKKDSNDSDINRREYAVAHLFYRYISDRFGYDMMKKIVHSTGEGKGIVSSNTGIAFDSLFKDFVLANYFGTTKAPNPSWNYSSVDIKVNTLPLQLDVLNVNTINKYAADYIDVSKEANVVEVKFNATDKNASFFVRRIIEKNNGTIVENVTLDNNKINVSNITDAYKYNRIVYVIARLEDQSSKNGDYSISVKSYLPDLTPTNITLPKNVVNEGEKVEFNTTIKNQGNYKANDVVVNSYLDYSKVIPVKLLNLFLVRIPYSVDYQEFNETKNISIDAFSTKPVDFEFIAPPVLTTTTTKLWVYVDPYANIYESDEYNNNISKDITIKSCMRECLFNLSNITKMCDGTAKNMEVEIYTLCFNNCTGILSKLRLRSVSYPCNNFGNESSNSTGNSSGVGMIVNNGSVGVAGVPLGPNSTAPSAAGAKIAAKVAAIIAAAIGGINFTDNELIFTSTCTNSNNGVDEFLQVYKAKQGNNWTDVNAMNSFLVALALTNDNFIVSLYDEPLISEKIRKTNIGKVLFESDLKMKEIWKNNTCNETTEFYKNVEDEWTKRLKTLNENSSSSCYNKLNILTDVKLNTSFETPDLETNVQTSELYWNGDDIYVNAIVNVSNNGSDAKNVKVGLYEDTQGKICEKITNVSNHSSVILNFDCYYGSEEGNFYAEIESYIGVILVNVTNYGNDNGFANVSLSVDSNYNQSKIIFVKANSSNLTIFETELNNHEINVTADPVSSGNLTIDIKFEGRVWADNGKVYVRGDNECKNFIVNYSIPLHLDMENIVAEINGTLNKSCKNEINNTAKQMLPYVSGLANNSILPIIKTKINNGSEFEDLRQAFVSIAQAQWIKKHNKGIFAGLIDSNNTNGLETDEVNVSYYWNKFIECGEKCKVKGGIDFGNVEFIYSGNLTDELKNITKEAIEKKYTNKSNILYYGSAFYLPYCNISKLEVNATSVMFKDRVNVTAAITSGVEKPAVISLQILNPKGNIISWRFADVNLTKGINVINFSYDSYHYNATFGNYTASVEVYALGCNDLSIKRTFEVKVKPDLIITSLLANPYYAYENTKINISAIITNQDYGDAKNVSVKFYLDRKRNESLIYSKVIDLKAWNQAFINFSIENLSAGWHSVYLILDEENKINESNEENNELVIGILIERENITSNISDLIIANLTPGKTNPLINESIVFTLITKNTGNLSTLNSSYTYYYLGTTYLGNISVGVLDVNAAQTNNFTWTCPSTAGTYTIEAKADATNTVSEGNEANNELSYSIYCIGLPDLIVSSLSPSNPNPAVGQTVTFYVAIKNQGQGNAGYSRAGYYADGNYNHPDFYDYVSPLSPGGVSYQTFTYKCNTPGQHIIKAKADNWNYVSESNEGNNERSYTINCGGSPDLIVSSLSPSNPNPAVGQTVTFYVAIKNQGQGNAGYSRAGYYADGNYNHPDFYDYVSPLSPGGVSYQTFTYKCNTPGQHIIKAKADNWNYVSESNENNNEKSYNIHCI